MKIHNTYLRFCGVQAPYTSKNGYEIKPIWTNPDEEQIKRALEVTNGEDLLGKGFNGDAYSYSYHGRDLVVKKYNSQEFNKSAFDFEFEKLDELYEKDVKSCGIQQGEFAFRTPEGDEYLVSTRVKGKKPDSKENKFNEENLSKLVQVIAELDKPRQHVTENGVTYLIPMHYDLALGNIVIDEENAGIIDFEYLRFEDLRQFYIRGKSDKPDRDYNFSDVACVLSNLRGFEYRTLLPYLMTLKKEEASDLFDIYLECKSKYHSEKSKSYYALGDRENQMINELILKEKIHSEVLKNPDEDVKKAEVIKIQIARFMHIQGPYEAYPYKINIEQIHKYLDNALAFFEKKANDKHQDWNHRIYYKDGLELVKKWQGLRDWMEEQASPFARIIFSINELDVGKRKEISDTVMKSNWSWQYNSLRNDFGGIIYDDTQKRVNGYYPDDKIVSFEDMIDEYKRTGFLSNVMIGKTIDVSESQAYKLFHSKLTNRHIVTLDEHLGI